MALTTNTALAQLQPSGIRRITAFAKQTPGCILLTLGEPDGAFYVFPSIEKFGMSSDEFCTRLIAEKGVALVPGSCFAAEGFVRLSYCCSMENLEEGLNRLAAFVQTLEQRSA